MTAILTNTERPIYSPNLLQNFCRFDTLYTWNEVAGGSNGSATNSVPNEAESYSGLGRCRIFFARTGAFTFNNPDAGCSFGASQEGRYIVSFALQKSFVGMTNEFVVTAYINGLPNEYVCDLSTAGGHVDGQWNTYYFVLSLSQYDTVDFDFTARGSVIGQELRFDRFKVESDNKNLFSPTIYTPPVAQKNAWTSRTDTGNTQNLTASIDNNFGFAGDLNAEEATLITNTGVINARKRLRTLTVDVSFDVVIPSGSNHFIEIKFVVGGVTYRNSTVPFLKNAGQTQHISVSFTFPVGWPIETDNLTVKLTPTANCTISNRYLSVVEYV